MWKEQFLYFKTNFDTVTLQVIKTILILVLARNLVLYKTFNWFNNVKYFWKEFSILLTISLFQKVYCLVLNALQSSNLYLQKTK